MEPASSITPGGPIPGPAPLLGQKARFLDRLTATEESSQKLRKFITETNFFYVHRKLSDYNFNASNINILRCNFLVDAKSCYYNAEGVDFDLINQFRTLLIDERKLFFQISNSKMSEFRKQPIVNNSEKSLADIEYSRAFQNVVNTYSSLICKANKLVAKRP